MTEETGPTTIQKVDQAYHDFSNLMVDAENGIDPKKLDGKLLNIYTDLADAGDQGGLKAASSGNRASFMEAAIGLQRGLKQQSGLPRALQSIGEVTSEFEDAVRGLHMGFLNDDLVGRIASESGIKPIKGLVDSGKQKGYQQAIIGALANEREKYGLE